MEKLRKKDQLTIRFTTEQLRRLRRAAKVVTGQREEIVEPGTLAREYITAGVDLVLAGTAELQEAS